MEVTFVFHSFPCDGWGYKNHACYIGKCGAIPRGIPKAAQKHVKRFKRYLKTQRVKKDLVYVRVLRTWKTTLRLG